MKIAARSAVASLMLSVFSTVAMAGEPAKTPAKSETQATRSVSLRIEKMACGSCSEKVTQALSALDGVKTAKVELKAKGAAVEYQPSKVTPEQMVKAVIDVGFDASVAPGA